MKSKTNQLGHMSDDSEGSLKPFLRIKRPPSVWIAKCIAYQRPEETGPSGESPWSTTSSDKH